MNRLLELLFLLNNNYYINNMEIVDEDVNHCLLQMYFYMMIPDDEPNKENIWKLFHKSYENLTLEKQEYVKNDFLKIIKIQEKNQKQLEKEK